MPNHLIFKTKRLLIRQLTTDDQQEFYALMSNPKVMNPIPAKVLNQYESRLKLDEIIVGYTNGGHRKIWAVQISGHKEQ